MADTILVSQCFEQSGENGRRCLPKVEIFTRDKHSIGARIFTYVEWIGGPVRVTVVRIQLLPRVAGPITMVNVIADHHHAASVPNGALVEVSFAHPILIK